MAKGGSGEAGLREGMGPSHGPPQKACEVLLRQWGPLEGSQERNAKVKQRNDDEGIVWLEQETFLNRKRV